MGVSVVVYNGADVIFKYHYFISKYVVNLVVIRLDILSFISQKFIVSEL